MWEGIAITRKDSLTGGQEGVAPLTEVVHFNVQMKKVVRNSHTSVANKGQHKIRVNRVVASKEVCLKPERQAHVRNGKPSKHSEANIRFLHNGCLKIASNDGVQTTTYCVLIGETVRKAIQIFGYVSDEVPQRCIGIQVGIKISVTNSRVTPRQSI